MRKKSTLVAAKKQRRRMSREQEQEADGRLLLAKEAKEKAETQSRRPGGASLSWHRQTTSTIEQYEKSKSPSIDSR